MKKTYQKPMFMVEYYTLTQAIAPCGGIKIGFTSASCVKSDPHSTNVMRDWANVGGFIDTTGEDACSVNLTGYTEGSVDDMMCYFTSMNAAFNS